MARNKKTGSQKESNVIHFSPRNHYTALESDLENTLKDFSIFCGYIGQNAPLATQNGRLQPKICYEINKRLLHPKTGAKPTNRMEQYWSLQLWFQTALKTGLIVLGMNFGGKDSFHCTGRYSKFIKLNPFSQYWMIFHTWRCDIEASDLYTENTAEEMFSKPVMDFAFRTLCQFDSGQWIERDPSFPGTQSSLLFSDPEQTVEQALMWQFPALMHHFMDLGLIVYEESACADNASRRKAVCPVIERFRVTPFGVQIFSVSKQMAPSVINIKAPFDNPEDMLDMLLEGLYRRFNNIEEQKTNTKPFLACFPVNSVEEEKIEQVLDFNFRSGPIFSVNYDCKVLYAKSCYRVIRCSSVDTFEELHNDIQKAFGIHDEPGNHLYSFFIDGKLWSRQEIVCHLSPGAPNASMTYIYEAITQPDQRILYVYDLDACHQFTITFHQIEGHEIEDSSALEVIESVGDNPILFNRGTE